MRLRLEPRRIGKHCRRARARGGILPAHLTLPGDDLHHGDYEKRKLCTHRDDRGADSYIPLRIVSLGDFMGARRAVLGVLPLILLIFSTAICKADDFRRPVFVLEPDYSPANESIVKPYYLMQPVNPADRVESPVATTSPATQQATPSAGRHAWELPPIIVVGEKAPELHEEEKIGSYAQPRWTADRRFPETRVYV